MRQQLRAAGALGKRLVAELLFRCLQFVVGAPFTLVICIQISVAWVIRQIKQPASLQKVQRWQHWQRKQQQQKAGDDTSAQEAASAPVHVFPDPAEGHDSLAWKLVGPYMRQHGRHAIANSQLFNPEYVHFFMPGVGSLPYVVADVWNRVVIIGTGEPIAPRDAWRRLTEAFLQEFPEAYFYHITEEFADLLHDMGFWINGCGTETTLQVQSWAYSAKTRTIRAAARAARDSGVRVRELAPEELTDDLRAKLLHDVTGCWKQQKAITDRELRVFVRHVDFDNMQLRDGVRIFVAEAYDPTAAPPAYVDPLLQGAALNAKPPKPPRRSRSLGHALAAKQSVPQPLLHGCKSTSSLLSSTSSYRIPAGLHITASTDSLGSSSSGGSSPPGSISLAQEGSADASAACSSMASTGSLRLQETGKGTQNTDSPTGSGSPVSPDCFARVGSVLGPAGSAGPAGEGCTKHGLTCADRAAAAEAEAQQSDAAAASDQCSKGATAAAAVTALAPELVGFVLLDPLWEGGDEVGYVASVMRMKRSAHTGTLKLLIEDIISKLRKEGRRELTFGFAPLFNMNDSSGRRYLHWIRWVSLYLFHCANNVYAFKNLAYSKVRYGAGVNKAGTAFNDPNVSLTHVYLAAKHYMPGWNTLELYAFFKFVGIIDNPITVFLKLLGVKKGGENLE